MRRPDCPLWTLRDVAGHVTWGQERLRLVPRGHVTTWSGAEPVSRCCRADSLGYLGRAGKAAGDRASNIRFEEALR